MFNNNIGCLPGDEFMMALGKLCGHRPSKHWMDIIDVRDSVVTHSWHQDAEIIHIHDPPYNEKIIIRTKIALLSILS